jgi:hypothetical protein
MEEGVIPTKEVAAMNFQNLTLAILLAAYYTRSLDSLYRPDRYTDRRRAALVAGARAIWYDGFRAGLEHATPSSG